MYTLEVKEIEFDDFSKSCITKNYPESGFYLRTSKANETEQCDLVFIDKSTSHTCIICPKSVFNGLQKLPEKITEQPEVLIAQSAHPEPGFVSESFVLDFAKLILKK